jgi:hypothetical protein
VEVVVEQEVEVMDCLVQQTLVVHLLKQLELLILVVEVEVDLFQLQQVAQE